MTRNEVVMRAREFIDVPFVYQGRNRNGTDCAGLLVQVAGNWMTVKDFTAYRRRFKDVDVLLNIVEDHCVKVCNGTGGYMRLSDGQVLVFMIRGLLPHLAIVTGTEWMIHAYQLLGAVKETRVNQEWLSQVHSVWDFKGIE